MTLIIGCALWLFTVPMQGNFLLLYLVVLVFIAANLTLGITSPPSRATSSRPCR